MLVENLEELVYFSLQEITQPIDKLGPETPTIQAYPYPPPQSPSRVMAATVNQPTWREITPLYLDAPLHDLSNHSEQVLPKFDPEKGIYIEDHLKSFYLVLNLLIV